MRLEVTEVGYKYTTTGRGCESVSFEAESGGLTVLRGPSGSGKSTALAVIAGVLEGQSGSALLDGKSLDTKLVALVLQSAQLFDRLTLWENVACAWGNPSRALRGKAVKEMVPFGLDKYAMSFPSQLSGGQRQRAALLAALAQEKPVLLVDEPTSSLDAANANVVIEMLTQAAKTRVVVVASHDDRLVTQAARLVSVGRQ